MPEARTFTIEKLHRENLLIGLDFSRLTASDLNSWQVAATNLNTNTEDNTVWQFVSLEGKAIFLRLKEGYPPNIYKLDIDVEDNLLTAFNARVVMNSIETQTNLARIKADVLSNDAFGFDISDVINTRTVVNTQVISRHLITHPIIDNSIDDSPSVQHHRDILPLNVVNGVAGDEELVEIILTLDDSSVICKQFMLELI